VIGQMKMDGDLGRCYLKRRQGDAANAILSAVGYNRRAVLAWLGLDALMATTLGSVHWHRKLERAKRCHRWHERP
jgi:hypothetical protein